MGAEIEKKLNLMDLSDEEFEKLQSLPENAVLPEDPKEETTEEEQKEEVETLEEKKEEPPAEETVTPPAEKLVDPKATGPDVFQAKPGETAQPKAPEAKTPSEEKKPEEKVEAAKDPSTQPGNLDYKAFFDRVMAPFKANGKVIQLQSAEEVVQLLQMGANYTKKMQALQPQKKLLMMLENNGLLDENELSFLIDLHKKNPEAIKKLLKDANIDPIEVDVSKVNYRSGSHAVSDQEAALQTAIEDLNARDGGRDTLQSINNWDQASKKTLWSNPELLDVIHSQRVNGIYDQITTEMERRRLLGVLPNAPFLQAYKLVGDELAARGAFQSTSPQSQTPGQKPVGGAPVAVRPAVKTPPTKAPDNRVKAAAPTRTSPRVAQAPVNYLAMSDEEFMKLPHDKV